MPALTYTEAAARFAAYHGRHDGPPLANNTRLVRTDRGYGVRLHRTVVVEIHPNDTCTLTMGGWNTVTTRDRLNAFSPATVIQRQGTAYLVIGTSRTWVPFHDGVRVDASGNVCDGPYAPSATARHLLAGRPGEPRPATPRRRRGMIAVGDPDHGIPAEA